VLGPLAAAVELVETGAAVLLEARETEETSSKEGLPARYVSGTLFFEPDALRAKARFFQWVNEIEARGTDDAAPPAAVILCATNYEDFLEGEEGDAPRIERFGAAGLYEIACEVSARRAHAACLPSSLSPSKRIHLYVTRDITGAVAAVALELFSS
jgi:hypothetical protein